MKHALLAAIIVCLTGMSAQARIGETKAQIDVRYGDGHKIRDRIKGPGATTFQYKKNNYTIEVVFVDDKSILEVLHRDDKDITDDDIKDIIKLNQEASSWSYDRKDQVWKRRDKKLEAFREPGHPQFLFIQDIAAVTALKGPRKASTEGF